MQTRSQARTEFLTDVFHTAIENYGYGAFVTHQYKWQSVPEPFAKIVFEDEDGRETNRVYTVDADTIAHGLGKIRRTAPELLSIGFNDYKTILAADRENDASDIDVVLALAILECALFGKVVYA